MRRLLCFAFVAIGINSARADDQAPPAPLVTMAVLPSPSLVVPNPSPQGPVQAMTASPQAPIVQAMTASPQGPVQAMTTSPSQPLVLRQVHPGPIRWIIGSIGESMARQKNPVYLHVPQVAAAPAPVTMQVVPNAAMQAVPVQAMVIPGAQSPNPFRRGSLFPLWR